MYCPNCGTEYRPGFTHCTDCDVDLVWDPPKAIVSRQAGYGRDRQDYDHVPGEPGDPNSDPFCSFWKGDDARVHAELCEVLDEAGIAHNTVFRRDHLFNLTNYPAYEVGVPFSMFQRAENAVKEAYGTEDVMDVGSTELQGRVLPERSSAARKLPSTLTPPAGEEILGPPTAGDDQGWFPEDATVKVWSTESNDNAQAEFLVAALHENGIRCRADHAGRSVEIFVLEEDEERAREIVREVVNNTPREE
ncbi:MAG TPA: DUF2007 domain-containing protein [Candidatus Saccharimonadales bacterium]|nr:DUF2007 domain-containing protein [Candidatus Saccharimonadales bacterium]